MRLDRWLWRLQVALIASAPVLVILAILVMVYGDGVVHYEHVYEDGTVVKTREMADPVDRWLNFALILVTALWQLGMGAALFCLRRIGHRVLANQPDQAPEGDRS